MITRTFKLCLNAGTGSAPYINVSQYDEGETWLFELYSETGERYIPTTGAIVGVKSDGHGIVNTGTVDSEGRVVITETQQMTASAGRAIFELSIDGLTHGTANFVVAVERKPTDDAVMSDSDLSLIQEAVDAAATIEDLIEGHDPDEVIAGAVDAWLDAHPEATTTVEDGAITEAKLNDSVKTGVFEDMTVGTSLAVMNDEGQTDNLAYKFRQTGGDAVRELDEIVGGTIAWNQMVKELNSTNWATESGVTATYADGVATFSSTTEGYGIYQRTNVNATAGHRYIVAFDCKGSAGLNVRLTTPPTGVAKGHTIQTANTWETEYAFVTNNTTASPRIYVYVNGSTYENLQVRNVMIFDLTQMLGSTVADAIYAMEQSSTGSGVAYFRSLFPNSYYAYNSGELVSVEGLSSHETTGFNQWDEEWEVGNLDANGQPIAYANYFRSKNFIPVFPNTDYYFKSSDSLYVWAYDADKTIIGSGYTFGNVVNTSKTMPSNCRYIKFVDVARNTYNNDICINLSSSLNGTYKPYQKHTYPLDSTLTLRGVPKWNNGLYFDGDIYRHDGSVSRRYGTRAYQSGDESIADAITDGTNTVYKLTTPTSETADPYQQYQICDGKGTEEYVSETVTPVGHSTFYPVDIVAKVNGLPSDFSTLIAPTEEGFKATRNYTAKQFLIINNQLYKVTANIANGGTITPNTNVTAVTIADILTTLI